MVTLWYGVLQNTSKRKRGTIPLRTACGELIKILSNKKLARRCAIPLLLQHLLRPGHGKAAASGTRRAPGLERWWDSTHAPGGGVLGKFSLGEVHAARLRVNVSLRALCFLKCLGNIQITTSECGREQREENGLENEASLNLCSYVGSTLESSLCIMYAKT